MSVSAFSERLADRAARARIALSPLHARQLEIYFDLLVRWNARMNLTALPLEGAPDHTIDRLFIEPLAASRYVEKSALDWFDIGSGGGSPAIPLKVLRAEAKLTMVESKGRKAAFLREAVRTLELRGACVEARRFEELQADGSANLITIRAVRIDTELMSLCRLALRKGGDLLLFSSESATSAEDGDGFRLVRKVQLAESQSFLEVRRAV